MHDVVQDKRKHPVAQRKDYTAFDRAMIRAEQDRSMVEFKMATDEIFRGKIVSVDTYFIEIDDVVSISNKIWIGKPLIVSARVLR